MKGFVKVKVQAPQSWSAERFREVVMAAFMQVHAASAAIGGQGSLSDGWYEFHARGRDRFRLRGAVLSALREQGASSWTVGEVEDL